MSVSVVGRNLRRILPMVHNNNNEIGVGMMKGMMMSTLERMESTTTREEGGGGLSTALSWKMEVVKDDSLVEELAKKGASLLQSGGVIGVPTDTVYGIAGDAQNDEAISKIYKIKGRDFRKPIAICVPSIEQVGVWGRVGRVPRELLTDLLPGPVTLVFERQPGLNPNLNPNTNLIGIRIPDNKFIINLAKFHNGPVALTSANTSGAESTLEVEEFKDLWPSLDCVFDGGRLSSCEKSEKAARAGSTVIDLSKEGFYRIIREGTAHLHCIQILQGKYSYKEHFDDKNTYGEK